IKVLAQHLFFFSCTIHIVGETNVEFLANIIYKQRIFNIMHRVIAEQEGTMKKRVFEISLMIIGTFSFALAVNLFIIPNELGEGGVTGITIIAYYLYGWSPGLV